MQKDLLDNVRKYPVNGKTVSKALSMLTGQITPGKDSLFDAFAYCPYEKLKVIWLGQDPYPQSGIATGIAFGNKTETPSERISPSLKILRNYAYKYLDKSDEDCNFDITLKSWEEQGVLMLNSSLTTKVGEIGSHTMIWRPVISEFISKISWIKPDLVYILSGGIANSFKPYIVESAGIASTVHPSFCVRTSTPFPDVFNQVNGFLRMAGKDVIKWV